MPTSNLGTFVQVLDALEGTGTAAWGWDVETDEIRWSANTGPLYGRERGYSPGSYEEFLTFVHPEDRSRVQAAVGEALASGTDYEFDIRALWPDGSVKWLTARGHAVMNEGRTVRIVGVVSDITARKRKQEFERFLADAGEVMVSTISLDEMLQSVAGMLVSSIADWCSVQMLEGGRLRTTATSHRDPERVALARRLQEEYPPDPEPTGLAAEVIATGRAILLEEIPEELLLEAARDERHLELIKSLGLRSAITAPLKARGHVLGLMSIVSAESGHRFGPDDVAFAEEFGRRAGMAVDNARLMNEAVEAHQTAEEKSHRLALLATLVGELSKAPDIDSVAKAALDHGVRSLGAARGSVVLVDNGRPAIVAGIGFEPGALEAYGRIIDEPGPLADAVSTGEAVYCGTTEELLERYPNLNRVRPTSPTSYAAVPLHSSNEVVGALGLVFTDARSFDVDDRQFLAALGSHIGVAVERGRLYDEIRSVAAQFQRALAPPPVEALDRIAAAARYMPAGVGGIGGDWYDIVRTPRDTFAFIVGDVVGRGMDAVAAMAQLRHSIRLLLIEGRSPAEALEAVSLLTKSEPNTLGSTILCVDVDPELARATIVSVGHIPPVVVRDGRACLIDIPVNPPLGASDRPLQETTIDVRPDEALIMLTDGIVERRNQALDRSLAEVCGWLGGFEPEPEKLAQALLDWSDDVTDDATVLVLRLEP